MSIIVPATRKLAKGAAAVSALIISLAEYITVAAKWVHKHSLRFAEDSLDRKITAAAQQVKVAEEAREAAARNLINKDREYSQTVTDVLPKVTALASERAAL